MKFECEKSMLASAIEGVSRAITNRAAIPVLEGIYMKAEGFNLTLTGYDMEMGITTTIECNVLVPGETVLDAKLLGSMVSRMPAGNVRNVALNNPILILTIFCAVLIAVLYWFFGTELGCSLRATGANQNMARAQGINTNVTKVLGLMISNGLVALAGGLLAQYQGFSDINMGRGAIVIGLAAVIIGEVIFSRIFRNFALKLLSAVIGAIIYYIVMVFVLRLGLSTDDLKLLTALVVALFLTIPYWKGKYFSKPVKKAKEDAKNA